MLIIDLFFCFDFGFEKIFCCFLEYIDQFVDVFVCVWFKLFYCDMGFWLCWFGFEILFEVFLWEDFLFFFDYFVIDNNDIVVIKCEIFVIGFVLQKFILIVWVFVFIFCGSDKCGGVNGVCICLVF